MDDIEGVDGEMGDNGEDSEKEDDKLDGMIKVNDVRSLFKVLSMCGQVFLHPDNNNCTFNIKVKVI